MKARLGNAFVRFFGLTVTLSLALSPVASQEEWAVGMVGDVFCVEGYVMDLFCINRGTLFDNPNVTTLSLEGPPIHSVHCLLDVPDCIASAFEIIIPPLPTTPDLYQRGWRLDDMSKMDVVALAQSVGICEECNDMGMNGTVERGLYVSLTATMQDVGSADSPPIITASNITVGNATTVPKCAFITRPPPALTGTPTAAPLDATPAPAPATGGDIMTIEDGLTLQSVDNGDNTATFTLVYEGESWVALGVSPTGVMVGSLAVIGLADGADPVIYNLTSKETSGVVPANANQQILTSSSFAQQGGITTLTFTVPLDTTETPFSVSSSAENRYIYAYGTSNELGYHAARGDFSASLKGGPKVGDEFCVEGYLMDEFCIKLGTLVDNPNVTTLSPEGPPIHSIRCMLDVADCLASPFELVVKPQNGETMFQRGWRLDDDAKETAVTLAKQVGKCDVCSGSQVNNFYLSMTATMQDLGTADRPPLISVKNMDIVAGDPVQTCSVITNPPPAPAPDDAAPAPAPSPGGVLTLDPGLTLAILDNGDSSATYTLVYEGEGWVGFGVSTDGAMVGSQTVIGLPGAGDPVIYNLASKDSAGVVPAASDQQILKSSSITQEDGITTLTFTVPVESDAAFSVSASGDTGYVWGYGSSNELGYHAARGAVSTSLQIAGDGGGADDQVCIEGYIMDLFCINRGTLYDNPTVDTLSAEGPTVHSVHCLIDVPECIGSAFDILLPSTTGDGFIQGWRLDDSTKAQAVALAKASGVCGDCGGGGTIERGLYVALTATISDPSTQPPTVSVVGDISVGTSDSLTMSCPGGSAYPPTVDEKEVPSGIISLKDGFTLQSVDNGDNTATFTLVYDGEGWIGYGVSPSGQMVGSQSVLGLPDSGEDPQLYDLNSQSNDGVVLAPSDQQILTSSSITQENGVTTLIFTVPLDASGPFSIASTGETGYIYAYGTSNELGYHAARGALSASLQGEASVVDVSRKYKAHGWIMSIAWGIFVPLAIGASMLRDLCPGPPGTFFMIHRALNTTAIVLVIIGFALAVSAVEAEGLPHFSQNEHRTTGIVIFVFSLAQGLNGYLRPHLPHTPDTDADADKDKADATVDPIEEGDNLVTDKVDKPHAEEKSGARKMWEIGHRLLGFGLLATSWWNCVTGIQYFNLKFADMADPALVSIFLGVTLGLSGVIFVIYAGRKVLKKSQ